MQSASQRSLARDKSESAIVISKPIESLDETYNVLLRSDTAQYIKQSILPDFFKLFWVRRMALDLWNYCQVLETTAELAHLHLTTRAR